MFGGNNGVCGRGNAVWLPFANPNNYANCTVDRINSPGSVSLYRTMIRGDVDVAGSIYSELSSARNILARGSIEVVDSSAIMLNAEGSINSRYSEVEYIEARGTVEVRNSEELVNSISAGGSAIIYKCNKINSIQASYVEVIDCKLIDHIESRGKVNLKSSMVSNDVIAISEASIKDSVIKGTLETSSEYSELYCSTVNKITFKPIFQRNVTFSFGGNNVCVFASDVSGDCIINGFSVNDIMRHQNQTSASNSNNNPKQILEINNGSTVGNILFESGNGEVILRNGSNITGFVTGGAYYKA